MEQYTEYKKYDFSDSYKNTNIDKKFYLLLNEYFSRRKVEMDFTDEELVKDVNEILSKLKNINLRKSNNSRNGNMGYYNYNNKIITIFINKCKPDTLFSVLAHELGHLKNSREAFMKQDITDSNKKEKRSAFSILKDAIKRNIIWARVFNEIYAENKAYRLDSKHGYLQKDSDTIETIGYYNTTPIMAIMSNITGVSVKELLKNSEKQNSSFEETVLCNCKDQVSAKKYVENIAKNVHLLHKLAYSSSLMTEKTKDNKLDNLIHDIHKNSIGILIERMKMQLPNLKKEELNEYINTIKFSVSSITNNLELCSNLCTDYIDVSFSDTDMYVRQVIQRIENINDFEKLRDNNELDKIFIVTDNELKEFKDELKKDPYYISKNKYNISDDIMEKGLNLKRTNRYDNTQLIDHISKEIFMKENIKDNKNKKKFKFLTIGNKDILYLNPPTVTDIEKNSKDERKSYVDSLKAQVHVNITDVSQSHSLDNKEKTKDISR